MDVIFHEIHDAFLKRALLGTSRPSSIPGGAVFFLAAICIRTHARSSHFVTPPAWFVDELTRAIVRVGSHFIGLLGGFFGGFGDGAR